MIWHCIQFDTLFLETTLAITRRRRCWIGQDSDNFNCKPRQFFTTTGFSFLHARQSMISKSASKQSGQGSTTDICDDARTGVASLSSAVMHAANQHIYKYLSRVKRSCNDHHSQPFDPRLDHARKKKYCTYDTVRSLQ